MKYSETINNARFIQLSQGFAAIVDAEDFEWLNQWVWTLHSKGYAYRKDFVTRKPIFMHRLINKTPQGLQTDHINRIRLDNRRQNLRSVTAQQNSDNSFGSIRTKKSYPHLPPYVTWDKARKKYKSGSKHHPQKRFNTLEEAKIYAEFCINMKERMTF